MKNNENANKRLDHCGFTSRLLLGAANEQEGLSIRNRDPDTVHFDGKQRKPIVVQIVGHF